MKNMKKITKLESVSLIYLLTFPLFMGVGFSKIIKNVGSDAWISILIGTIMGLGINFIIKSMPREDNKFFKLLYSICFLVIGTMLIGKLVSSIYLSRTPTYIVLIPGAYLIYYTALKGRETLYKSAGILVYLHIFLFLCAAFTLVPTIKVDYFLPVMTNSISKILLSALDFALISTSPMILVDDFKEKYDYKVYLASAFLLLIILLCTIGNLGLEVSKLYRYPEYMVFKRISILNFIENIENILFALWIINIFVLTGLSCVNIKEITNSKCLLIILIIMIWALNKYALNTYKVTDFYLKYYTYMLLGVMVLFILSKIFRKRKKT